MLKRPLDPRYSMDFGYYVRCHLKQFFMLRMKRYQKNVSVSTVCAMCVFVCCSHDCLFVFKEVVGNCSRWGLTFLGTLHFPYH